jgi:hypothetical protein
VGLAVGQAQLAQTPAGILISDSEVEPLMPTHYLIALGFQMKWTGKGCMIYRGGNTLPVALQHGRPTLPLDLGLKLLEEYEQMRSTQQFRLRFLQAKARNLPEDLVRDPISWLEKCVRGEEDDRSPQGAAGSLPKIPTGAQLTQFLSALSEAPSELVARAVGSGPALSGNQTPWNRRRRRQLARGNVLVHLFAGAQRGED